VDHLKGKFIRGRNPEENDATRTSKASSPVLPATTASQHGEEKKKFQQLSGIMVVVDRKE
jgi:hypothetical protein